MFCHTYSSLLEEHCIATSNYLKAILVLTKLAGHGDAPAFGDAKHQCDSCLDECKRTRGVAEQHKFRHGCLY